MFSETSAVILSSFHTVSMVLLSKARISTHQAKQWPVPRVATLHNGKAPLINCLGRRLKKHDISQMQARSTCKVCQKIPQPTRHAVTDEDDRPVNDADESGARSCSHCSCIFEAREGNCQDRSCETILDCVPRVLGEIQSTVVRSQERVCPRS